jgi:hypothetical protein
MRSDGVGIIVFRYRLRTLLIGCAVLAALFAFLVRPLHLWSRRLKAEYATAYVIRDVTVFVESHQGQWPKNWNDIPTGDDAQQWVRMRFDVTVDELINNPSLIHSVIVPVTGDYHTWPHAEMQLNDLREILIRLHEQPQP